ncbi:MAG: glycosyltransferase [Proteobacteria bacterium]|nr:glycosyltransferase [Pseudomonadota bacterium]
MRQRAGGRGDPRSSGGYGYRAVALAVAEAALRLPDGLAAPETRAGVFIDATKQPSLGRALAAALRGRGCQVALCDRRVLRHEYLAQMAAAAIAVTLPYATEGFYLPGLEAMALGCATIVPDCIGNRAYLADGRNALAPPLQLDALLQAVQRLDDAALFARLVTHGRETAARFGLQREREAFHAVLDDIDHLWNA